MPGGRPDPLRIVLADDHALLLDALTLILQPVGTVVATAQTGQALLDAVHRHGPDLVITDLSMPGMSGIEAIRAIRTTDPKVPIIALTVHADVGVLRTTLEAGASGYVVKSAAALELLTAVRAVMAGERHTPPVLTMDIETGAQTPLERLSERERAVLALLADGLTSRQIADRLAIAERTVVFHRERMRKRLGARSTIELINMVIPRRGGPAGI